MTHCRLLNQNSDNEIVSIRKNLSIINLHHSTSSYPIALPSCLFCVTFDDCLINSFQNLLFTEAHMCGIIGREVISLSSGHRKLKRWTISPSLLNFPNVSFFFVVSQNHRSWCGISLLLSCNFWPSTFSRWRRVCRRNSHGHLLRRVICRESFALE